MADYSFQTKMIEDVLQAFTTRNVVVLAAAPGAGKTNMAIAIVEKMISHSRNMKVLVLTHGQVLLRRQWLERISTEMEGIKYFEMEEGCPRLDAISEGVTVAIPQTLRSLPDGLSVDLLVVDEAHQFYGREMVNAIVKKTSPKKQLLLTGSPSKYLKRGVEVVGITISEMLDKGVVCDPLIELAEFSYDLGLADYNDDMEIRSSAVQHDQTAPTLDRLLGRIIARIGSENRLNPGQFPWIGEGGSWGDVASGLKKTMFVCRNKQHATDVYQYMERKGISAVLSISGIDTDSGARALRSFKEAPSCSVFIVVNRGVLGFDFSELFNIVDISGSLNIERMFQLLCRVVRVSKSDPQQKKMFIKLTSDKLSAVSYQVMSYVVALSLPEFYYSPTDFRITKIPVKREFVELLEKGEGDDKKERGPGLDRLPNLCTFREVMASSGDVRSFAYTDFQTVKDMLRGVVHWNKTLVLKVASQFETRAFFVSSFPGAYAWLVQRGLCPILDDVFRRKKLRRDKGAPLKRLPPDRSDPEPRLARARSCSNRRDLWTRFPSTARWLIEHAPDRLDELFPKKQGRTCPPKGETDAQRRERCLALIKTCETRSKAHKKYDRALRYLLSVAPDRVNEIFPLRGVQRFNNIDDVPHNRHRYKKYGCRCEICKEANSKYFAKYYQKHKQLVLKARTCQFQLAKGSVRN